MATSNTGGINNTDIQKTKEYSDALDKLHASIVEVNGQLPEFTDGMSAGLKAVASKLPEVVDSMAKLNAQNKELVANGQKPVSVFSQLGSSLLSWNSALSVGITLITTYGPKIIAFIGSLFDSDKAKAAAQALKDYNEVFKSYTGNLSNENGKLQTLLSVAKNETLVKETRLEAIKKLNAIAPEYLGSLNLANIKTQEGTAAINEYIKALKRKALEEAVQPKMAALLKERMELTEGYQAAKKERDDYRKAKINNPNAGKVSYQNQGSALGTSTTTDYALLAEKNFKEYADKDINILKRIKSLDDLLTQQLKGLAPKAFVQPKAVGKSYWLGVLNDQQAELDKLDAGAKDFEKKAKPIIDRINKTKKTLSKYDLPTSQLQSGGKKTGEDKTITHDSPFEDVKLDMSPVTESMMQSNQRSLDAQKEMLLHHTVTTQRAITDVEGKAARERAEAEDKLVKSKIHGGDKLIDAALKNSKKDSAIFKAAFLAKKATAIADTVISTKRAVIESLKAYAGIPFIGQALGIAQAAFMAIQGATSIAEISKQKPGFARGGRFISDGKGALLPGYSRTDNTNAYLRSGEAVVVSEAMRNPWARNLVSAINVAHGGRDFSIANPGRGYAIGGIFTDGGNSNRYYNQPMNDQTDLANTIAYQMVNNFPPIYVDVKDINSQQSILAQTVNRVNL